MRSLWDKRMILKLNKVLKKKVGSCELIYEGWISLLDKKERIVRGWQMPIAPVPPKSKWLCKLPSPERGPNDNCFVHPIRDNFHFSFVKSVCQKNGFRWMNVTYLASLSWNTSSHVGNWWIMEQTKTKKLRRIQKFSFCICCLFYFVKEWAAK